MSALGVPRYAVFGNPIAHSRSPDIHHRFAESCNLRLEYARILAPLEGFAASVWHFRDALGGRGCNVTLPFKAEAASMATEASARVHLAGAANTLTFRGRDILADNTDGVGLVRDITRLGIGLAGEDVLLLGAGGAAAGVLAPLMEAGCASITLANRSLPRAEALAARHRSLGRVRAAPLTHIPPGDYRLIINATSSGLTEAALAVPDALFAGAAFAYDMVYGHRTAFLAQAARLAVANADGLGMLVEQAAAAFEIWHGIRPDTAPVLAALRGP